MSQTGPGCKAVPDARERGESRFLDGCCAYGTTAPRDHFKLKSL